jgi:hypothetical protein
LHDKTGWNLLSLQAITFRPFIGVVTGSEDLVDPRKMDGEILVEAFFLRGEQPFMVRYVKGVVHDLSGSELSNARFELRLQSGEKISAVTDSKGRFSVPNVPDGCYRFTAVRDGWQPFEANLLVRKKTRYSIPIRIRTQKVQTSETSPEPQISAAQA